MKNSFLYFFKSKIKLSVKGKNLERFIRRLHHSGIELLELNYKNYHEVQILIYKKDYARVLELKTVYEISVLDASGMIRIRKVFFLNRFFIISILFGIAVLFLLSQMIFQVEIIHTNKELRTLLMKELNNYGIKELGFQKSFSEIEKIKEEILNKHKDTIEWLEIENVGVKYVIRVEARKIVDIKKDYQKQNVVASKSAIIRKVEAKNGVILRNVNDYVQAGDVVISGEISLNEQVLNTIKADGKVYGEVWYQTTTEYPFAYYESVLTGKKKNVYVIQIFDHEIELFNFSPFNDKKTEDKIIFGHSFLPLRFVKQKQMELHVVEEMNTLEEAISKAEEAAIEKISSQLSDNETIISHKNLKVDIKKSKIVVDTFFTVYEDITSYREIVKTEEKLEE